jgi:phage shock protein C
MVHHYQKRIYRSEEDKIIAGVLGGFGEYFDTDPVLIRVIYVGLSIFTGIFPGIFAYVLMALIMPKKPAGAEEKKEAKPEEKPKEAEEKTK